MAWKWREPIDSDVLPSHLNIGIVLMIGIRTIGILLVFFNCIILFADDMPDGLKNTYKNRTVPRHGRWQLQFTGESSNRKDYVVSENITLKVGSNATAVEKVVEDKVAPGTKRGTDVMVRNESEHPDFVLQMRSDFDQNADLGAGAKWIIRSINESDGLAFYQSISNREYVCLDEAIRGKKLTEFLSMCEVVSYSESNDGTWKISFTYLQEYEHPKIELVAGSKMTGEITVDPKLNWRIRNWTGNVEGNNKPETAHKISVENEFSNDELSSAKIVTVTSKYTSVQHIKIDSFDSTKIDHGEFTLTHYGILAPVDDTSIPNWLIYGILGSILLIISAFLARKLKRVIET
jgi:hypothetical protein